MNRRSRSAKLACILLGTSLAGCGSSPPTHFYTLAPHAPSQPAAPPARTIPVTLGTIDLPQVIDRPEIVRSAGSNQVEIAAAERWGGPLEALTRSALTVDLQSDLPPGRFQRDDTPIDANAATIDIDFDHFQSDLSGHVTLDASWGLSGGNPAKTILRRTEHIEVDSAQLDFASMADAMSQALADLAQQIAGELPAK